MTVLNLVFHSDNNAIGSSPVVERFHPGRAGSPLVAAKCSDVNPQIVGTRKERSTVFNQYYPDAGSLLTVYNPCILNLISGIRIRYNSQFLSDTIDISSPPFFILHFGYASPARIQSGYGYDARI